MAKRSPGRPPGIPNPNAGRKKGSKNPNAGRKPDSPRGAKHSQISFRVAAITREAIEAAAAEQNQALSEWVLSACLEKMARQ